MNVPNALTASRLLLVLPFAWLLFDERPRWLLVSLFGVAALTDLFDGLLARRLDQVTTRGAWLDQMVDRAFTAAIVGLLLGHAFSTGRMATDSELPLPLLLALACTRELLALPAVALALARGVPLYHVERVGKLATFVQGIALAAIVLDLAAAGILAGIGAVVGIAAATNYTLYVRSAVRSRAQAGDRRSRTRSSSRRSRCVSRCRGRLEADRRQPGRSTEVSPDALDPQNPSCPPTSSTASSPRAATACRPRPCPPRC